MYIGSKPADKVLTASDITDGVVSNAKLAQDIISADTALGAEPADTDEFLVSDAGTLKRVDYSYIKDSGGITEADAWRLTADLTEDGDPISSNLERADDATFEKIGTGMSESSGTFTFPSTGLYLVTAQANHVRSAADDAIVTLLIKTTPDNSTYTIRAQCRQFLVGTSVEQNAFTQTYVNVTNTTNVKVRFSYTSSNSNTLAGDTDSIKTGFCFIRLGDSQ